MRNLTNEEIWRKIRSNHRRINEIAEIEADAAKVGGLGSNGELMPEKSDKIRETDEALDELEGRLFGS